MRSWLLLALFALLAGGCPTSPPTGDDDDSADDDDDDSAGDDDDDSAGDDDDDTAGSLWPADLTLLAVTGGTFTMGSDGPGPEAGDTTPHQVTVSDFELGETEVTNTQYLAFLGHALEAGWLTVETRSEPSPCGFTEDPVVLGGDLAPHPGEPWLQLSVSGGCTSEGDPESELNRSWITWDGAAFALADEARADWPVTWVKWYGAAAFAAFYELSLPSEAQWEYAASSGGSAEYATEDGTLDDSLANYNGDIPNAHNPDGHVLPVGSYPPSPWGFYDLAGNAWEWAADTYQADWYERSDGSTDPLNDAVGEERVKRGGSWNFHGATLSAWARNQDLPSRGNNHFGFRVARN